MPGGAPKVLTGFDCVCEGVLNYSSISRSADQPIPWLADRLMHGARSADRLIGGCSPALGISQSPDPPMEGAVAVGWRSLHGGVRHVRRARSSWRLSLSLTLALSLRLRVFVRPASKSKFGLHYRVNF